MIERARRNHPAAPETGALRWRSFQTGSEIFAQAPPPRIFGIVVQLADALFLAGKHFDLLPMLGTHMAGASDPVVRLREQMRIIEFFNRELKP